MFNLSPIVYCSINELSPIVNCSNPELLDECNIDQKIKDVLLENIKRRLTPQSVKIRSGKSMSLTVAKIYNLIYLNAPGIC